MTRQTDMRPDANQAKRLTLSKETLKDLAVSDSRGEAPKGGRIPMSRILCVTDVCATVGCTKP